MSYRSHISSITCRILDAEKNAYGELFTACDELYEALLQVTGIDISEDSNREHNLLDSGSAIGLTWAAMCIKDHNRTKRFMDGITQATGDMLKANTGRAVHILYTGTGPFATLMLPLIARYSEAQVQFTLLEVNDTSFNCLQKLINTLHLEKYIRRIEKADATTWNLTTNEPVDIFICETMQQGLGKEPQVALCMNIVPQLQSQTIIIPQQITLHAALIDLQKRMQVKFGNKYPGNAVHLLDTIFTLNKETILQHAATLQQGIETSPVFPETTVSIPAEPAASHPHLYLLTDIVVYNQEKLLTDESQLTLPMKLADLSQHQPVKIKFQYHTGKKPGIQFSMLAGDGTHLDSLQSQ
jgi:hypothetical protein